MRTSLFALLLALPLPAQIANEANPPAGIREIAARAYTFAYPLVLMEYTRRSTTSAVPENVFSHGAAFPDHRFRLVVRPNADTLYSSSWLNLSREPILVHVPDTAGRYYLMQFLDAWTETFAVPGKRTTGTAEGWFALVGPGWKGGLPPGVRRIDAPTNMVWLVGRTQTNNPSDYPNVHKIQKQYWLLPLSQYPNGSPPAPPDASALAGMRSGAVTPPQQVGALAPLEFFRIFASLLVANPPHPADEPLMRDLASIGIVAGQPFSPPPGIQAALEAGARAAAYAIESSLAGNYEASRGATGWSTPGKLTFGRYGTDYPLRASVARYGIGALPQEDAVYLGCRVDNSGQPLDGARRYQMHFDKSQLPPVNAFWSITMYGLDGYFVANPINRFAIGDRDPLKFNADGSLDLLIQHDPPAGRQANWLPTPAAGFHLQFRLYWPREPVLAGVWTPPAVTPVP